MAWTIIEDAETLDGASILDTTQKFLEWAEDDGKKEMEGSVFPDR